ncbi:MAG: DUF4835 family protein, partial [Bacteroidales bacterium]|nr:DUF4835 family protein [Bacteroidales bacterium]
MRKSKFIFNILTFIIVALFASTEIEAQELNATIKINHNQIQGTDASVFENLEQTLNQYVNDKQWTNLQFKRNERIDCTFNITVTKYDIV